MKELTAQEKNFLEAIRQVIHEELNPPPPAPSVAPEPKKSFWKKPEPKPAVARTSAVKPSEPEPKKENKVEGGKPAA